MYLLECVDGRVYTGIARDPEQRYAQHSAGKGARFTRANPPRALLGWVWVDSRRAALKLEIAWKRLPRAERIAALRAIPKTGQSQIRVTTRLLASGVATRETDCAYTCESSPQPIEASSVEKACED